MALAERIIQKLNRLTKTLVNGKSRIEVGALVATSGVYKKRIFNRAQATDGSDIGSYKSKSYKAKRKSRGRQTSKKDLFFEGDLFRSIQVGRSGSENVIGYLRNQERRIARFQEQQTRKDIFGISKNEVNVLRKAYVKLYKKEIINAVR